MLKVGFVGWRGMVGAVLMERMIAEKDFNGFEPLFASTSQVGQKGPDIGMDIPPLAGCLMISRCFSNGYHRHLPGRRLYQGNLSRASQKRLEGILDRCSINASNGRRQRHRPGSCQPSRHRQGACKEGLRIISAGTVRSA